MFTKIKQWLGIEERPEVREQQDIEELKEKVRPKDEDRIIVIGVKDPNMEEMINRVWKTGKACIGNVDDEGNLEITELD